MHSRCIRYDPVAVVIPVTQEEVIETVRLCHRFEVPFVARGSGTSLSGASLPVEGGIVIALNRLNRIVRLDPKERLAVVEPGVINLDVTKAAAVRFVFCTRSIESIDLYHWWESSLQFRRSTLSEVRHHQQPKPPLSPKQFDLMLLLWQRAGEAVSKDEIAAAIWPEEGGEVYDYQVDKLVSRLRDRLRGLAFVATPGDEAAKPVGETEELIETVWGYGFRLKV